MTPITVGAMVVGSGYIPAYNWEAPTIDIVVVLQLQLGIPHVRKYPCGNDGWVILVIEISLKLWLMYVYLKLAHSELIVRYCKYPLVN